MIKAPITIRGDAFNEVKNIFLFHFFIPHYSSTYLW